MIEKYKDKDWLHTQWYIEKKPKIAIADLCGCHRQTIQKWIEKFRFGDRGDVRYKDKEWLTLQYVDRNISAYKIAEQCKADRETVGKFIKKYNIKRVECLYMDKELFKRKYTDENMPTKDLCELLGCRMTTLHRWREIHGIPLRPHIGRGFYRHGGYKFIYVPPCDRVKKSKVYQQEHRMVMEEHIGRRLRDDEIVHHINAVRDDNRVENLTIVTRTNHIGEVDCPYCGRIFCVK